MKKLNEELIAILKLEGKLNNNNWDKLLIYFDISEDLLEKYINNFSIILIYTYQKLSPTFLEKHIPKNIEGWKAVCKYQYLPENILIKYNNHIIWEQILIRQQVPLYIIKKYRVT